MNRRSFPVLVAMVGAALLLGGCSSPAGLKALERPATAEDSLPESVRLAAEVEVDTVRLLATHEGVKYFGAENDRSGMACVAVVSEASPSLWVAGCGSSRGAGGIVTVTGPDRASAQLVGDGFDTKKLESDGWTKIHHNVLVSGR